MADRREAADLQAMSVTSPWPRCRCGCGVPMRSRRSRRTPVTRRSPAA